MKTKKGFYWHVHHDRLIEWCYDYQERVDYIKKNKPENEIKTRLKLFKPVKHPELLPKKFAEAGEKYNEALEKYYEAEKKYYEALKKYFEAGEKYDVARKKYYEAREKYYEAGEKYDEAEKKYDVARKKYRTQLEKLHKKECGCKEWNGKEIVFKK